MTWLTQVTRKHWGTIFLGLQRKARSRIGGVRVVPNFHIKINALIKRIVVLKAVVGTLHTFHYTFDLPSLMIVWVLRHLGGRKLASLINIVIFNLHITKLGKLSI